MKPASLVLLVLSGVRQYMNTSPSMDRSLGSEDDLVLGCFYPFSLYDLGQLLSLSASVSSYPTGGHESVCSPGLL